MDKLAPVIKHHFWILFVIALILPPVGWWMTTSELAAEIDSRRSALDSSFSSIPSDPKPPNEDWKKAADGRILTRKEQNRLALDRLWKSQTDLMVWPPNIAQYMSQCPYREDHPDSKVSSIIPSLYRDDYEREINRIWLITEPDRTTVSNVQIAGDAPQKVLFPLEGVPRVSRQKWTQLPPTWREIWNAQEDIWLLGQIFTAVRNVNQGTESITDANIKQIQEVQLFGGTRAPAPAGGAAAATSGMPGMPSMGMSMGRGAGSAVTAEFPMTEEYSVADTLGGGAGGRGGAAFGPTMSMIGPGGANAAAVDPNADDSRYVAKEAPYRSRGFKIRVSIDQMRVPDFIKELLNSDYATTITRYQWTVMNAEDADGTRSRTITLPSAGGSGYPGGDYGGTSPMTLSEGGSEDLYSNLTPPDSTGTSDFASPEPAPGMASSANSGSLIQSALSDTRLVELVVVGEMYIYNPPPPVEGAVESADAAIGDNTATITPDAVSAGAASENAISPVGAAPDSSTAPADANVAPVNPGASASPAGAATEVPASDGEDGAAASPAGEAASTSENNPADAGAPAATPTATP